MTDEDEKTQRYRVDEIITHPLFNEFMDFDFALLKLKQKLDLSVDNAPIPVCLPPADTYDSLMDSWKDKIFTVAGWGKAAENAGASTRRLQKLDVPYMEWDTCKKTSGAKRYLTRRMICAAFKEAGKDACTGERFYFNY